LLVKLARHPAVTMRREVAINARTPEAVLRAMKRDDAFVAADAANTLQKLHDAKKESEAKRP
jgi:hypothetical protein